MPRQSMDELAMNYVIFVNTPSEQDPYASDIAWNYLQEMLGRAGVEITNVHLNKARATYQMITGPKVKGST